MDSGSCEDVQPTLGHSQTMNLIRGQPIAGRPSRQPRLRDQVATIDACIISRDHQIVSDHCEVGDEVRGEVILSVPDDVVVDHDADPTRGARGGEIEEMNATRLGRKIDPVADDQDVGRNLLILRQTVIIIGPRRSIDRSVVDGALFCCPSRAVGVDGNRVNRRIIRTVCSLQIRQYGGVRESADEDQAVLSADEQSVLVRIDGQRAPLQIILDVDDRLDGAIIEMQ